MKKLTILICVLAILLSLAGVASASKPEEGEFSITGSTTFYDYEVLPSGRTKFHLTAVGDASGHLTGTFSYEEKGNVGFDPLSGEGTWRGTNHATMTITNTGDSIAVVKFRGRTIITGSFPISPTLYVPLGFVEGTFTVLHGTGDYAGVHGQGTYTATLPPPLIQFTVTFTGQFHTDPQ